jgi:predicted transglutaminase-like cysteine proteinase
VHSIDLLPFSVAHYVVESVSQANGDVDPIHTAAIVPGVFGSYAIPMRNFPVSRKWVKVYQAIDQCAAKAKCGGSALTRLVAKAEGRSFLDKIGMVNAEVNRLVRYRRDSLVYGKFDYWASPSEILAKGAGDCEDFAILKMAALRKLDIPASSMSLVVLQIRGKGVFHAVLALTTSRGTYILDNVADAVGHDTALSDYDPLFSLSVDRAWIHGRKAGAPRVADTIVSFNSIAPGEGVDGETPAAPIPGTEPAGRWELRASVF